jgi:tetratricopeptide (TPR) repeat protein
MKVLLAAISLIALVGCSSTGSKSSNKDSLIYVKGSKSQSKKDVSRWAKCKVPKKANRKNWKDWVNNINVCVKDQKWQRVDKYSEEMLTRFPDSPWGMYFASLSAEVKGNEIRAFWMIDKALKDTPNVGLFHFQKARLLMQKNEMGLARATFEQAFALDNSLVEAAKFLAIRSYNGEDYKKAKYYFGFIEEDQLNEDLLVAKMETHRGLGENEIALDIALGLSKKYTKNFNYSLRVAQLLEEFPEKRKEALQAYQNLLKHAKKLDISQKIARQIPDKISNLKRIIAKAEQEEKKQKESK